MMNLPTVPGNDGEVYNVANEDTYISIMEMAQMVCDTFMPGKRPVVALRRDMGYSPTTKLRLNAAKLRSLGWKPRYDLKEMFARLIASQYQAVHQIHDGAADGGDGEKV